MVSFFIENVAATTDAGISLLPTSKQELDASEEFGPKLPPAFSSGRFCRLLVGKFWALKSYVRYTVFLFKKYFWTISLPLQCLCYVKLTSANALLLCYDPVAGTSLPLYQLCSSSIEAMIKKRQGKYRTSLAISFHNRLQRLLITLGRLQLRVLDIAFPFKSFSVFLLLYFFSNYSIRLNLIHNLIVKLPFFFVLFGLIGWLVCFHICFVL